jgi:dihydrofolate reductase
MRKLMGRVSYQGFKGFWPPVADDPNATPTQREISRLNNAIDKVVIVLTARRPLRCSSSTHARGMAPEMYLFGTPSAAGRHEPAVGISARSTLSIGDAS